MLWKHKGQWWKWVSSVETCTQPFEWSLQNFPNTNALLKYYLPAWTQAGLTVNQSNVPLQWQSTLERNTTLTSPVLHIVPGIWWVSGLLKTTPPEYSKVAWTVPVSGANTQEPKVVCLLGFILSPILSFKSASASEGLNYLGKASALRAEAGSGNVGLTSSSFFLSLHGERGICFCEEHKRPFLGFK